MRNAERVRKCLLLGVDRTYRGHHESDAFDYRELLANERAKTERMFLLKVLGRKEAENRRPSAYGRRLVKPH